MLTVAFAAFLLMSMILSLVDWRRGWLMAIACGVLQDPIRKLTPGTPVVLTMSIIPVFAFVLLSAQAKLQIQARDFARRFRLIQVAAVLVFGFLILAALNGIMTFGLENWKAPALSLFIYCAPIPAVILGYAWLEREEQMYSFFRYYSAITAIALIGTPLEGLKVHWRALGMVGWQASYIRHIPGVQIPMLSGFYRAPDVMGLHAATLAIIGIAMALRGGVIQRAWPWLLLTGWGFLNAMISGRRKALYMILLFAALFVWRYFRRLSAPHVIAFFLIFATLGVIVHKVAQDQETSVYAKGATATQEELLGRLEGGLIGTIEQYGILGTGLGTATQGVYHVLNGSFEQLGWQEGGLGKLAMELGLPGLGGVFFLGYVAFVMMMRITRHPDVPGSSQFLRVTLFGLVAANGIEFLVSAQTYSDVVLSLMAAFFAGCFFATAALDERLPIQPEAAPALEAVPVS
jgi:hypothetical protein